MTEDATAERTPLGRYLAAYRSLLTRAEAARRAGVPEARWAEVETGFDAPGAVGTRAVSPQSVAAMCAAVGADIPTGLKLAGHDPREHAYLLTTPPRLMDVRSAHCPRIAIYRAIVDAAALAPEVDPRPRIAAIYRDVAAQNRKLAESIDETPPDERTDFWHGYASALRAIADEQSRFSPETHE
jgi:Helix-turn-helix domain